MTPLYPLPFEPFLRPMPWGGKRLGEWVGLPTLAMPVGEAWLLSDHPLHASRVASGPLQGVTLRQLMEERGEELLGQARVAQAPRFPLLIKLLDARERLSIQVHPDDADAERWAPAEGGKTEAWVILEADPTSIILLGLKPGVDKAMLARELAAGTAELCLRRHEPKPGECYLVPAGAVHALGGGLLLLEVQQTSDATFRLHDWGRVDAQGRPRPLHWEAGLACVKEHLPNAGLQRPAPLPDGSERLVSCDYFTITRFDVSDSKAVHGPCILIGLEGELRVLGGGCETTLARGHATLVPHSAGECIASAVRPARVAMVRW